MKRKLITTFLQSSSTEKTKIFELQYIDKDNSLHIKGVKTSNELDFENANKVKSEIIKRQNLLTNIIIDNNDEKIITP